MNPPTNEQRAERAYRLALIYAHSEQDNEDMETAIVDLTTDLLHLADQYGLSVDDVQRMSRHHHAAELHEERRIVAS